MSQDGHPFDPLGRILSTGGDIALANALSRGNQRQEIMLLARWRDWGASDSDIATARGIAEQAVSAGRTATGMDPDDPFNFSTIPTNPLLFGEDSSGLRFYASTDFQFNDSDKWYRADFKLPDLYSPADIISQIDAVSNLMIDKYPRMFKEPGVGEITRSQYAIQVIIGKF